MPKRPAKSATREVRSLKDRVGALRNIPPFLRMVWATSRAMTSASLALRLVRAVLPVATLYVGKLIIDEVVRLAGLPNNPNGLSACPNASPTRPACG